MSSWRKKMRAKWNRNLDSPSSSAGGCTEEPLGLFERRGSLRKPSPPSGKDEPFKRSWSFRIGSSHSKAKDASPGAGSGGGGGEKGAFLRMFRFGKDKKKEPGRRRMSDAAATEVAACKEELSQWSSVPLDVSESPEAKRREEALIMRAHTLPRSLEAAPSGSECPDDADGTVWGVIYCDPKADANDHFQLPRAKLDTPKCRDARGGKVFSNAVLPHFLHPGHELGGGESLADRRALKKLLLNGTCPAVSNDDDSFGPVGNGLVVCEGAEPASGDCGPPSVESVQGDSGVASGAESNEGKGHVAQPDPERDVPNAISEQCQGENPCTEDCGEPALLVEVNELYQDDCDETVEVSTCAENAQNDVPRADAAEGSQVSAQNDEASEGCLPEQNAAVNEEAPNDVEPIACERSHDDRQRHDSASTDSNCEECPAQDEFEFVAAEPAKREERRMSRETVSPVSDVSDEFPADEKASFIFLKPDNAGESLLSPLSTPDDELSCGPFARRSALNDDVLIEHFVCSDSDLESEDLNEPEEREVIIVDHLPTQESQDAPDICVISNDMIQSVNCETFVLENEVTPGTPSASSAQEAPPPHNGGVHVSARADSPLSPDADRSTPAHDAAADEAVDGEDKLEASEGSFQDKVHYFNAISAEQQSRSPPAAGGGPLSKRPRASRIPTASRLPRPSSARPAKKESGIPVLTAAPVPAKRSRVAAKVGHIPQPSRNPQQRQVTPPLTKVTAAGAPARDCSSAGTRATPFSGTAKNAKNARHAAAAAAGAVVENSSEAPKAQEAPGQLRRSGTFVLDESEQSSADAQSGSSSRAPGAVDVAQESPAKAKQPLTGKDKAAGPAADAAPPKHHAAVSPVVVVESVVVRDAVMKVAACAAAASVQVPVVDSTDHTLTSDGDNDEDLVCSSCNVKKGATGTAARLSSPGAGSGPPSKIGEARVQAQTKAEFTKEIQRLGALCESRTKELTMLKLQLRHASAGFASFGVVIQHLNSQNNSFHIPRLAEELRKSQEEIERARIAIEEYKNNIEEIKRNQEREIEALKAELEGKHTKKIEELEAAHKNELAGYLESHARKLEEMKAFYTSIIENDRKSHEETLDSLKQRHREKIDAINEEYSLQLDSINEDHQTLQKELDERHETLLQQYKTLQQQAKEFQESVLLDTDAKIQWLSKKNADLQKEVESLNVVLEMRANQIQSLQRNTLDMERKEEELHRCKAKMDKMEARIEDLQELLTEKVKLQSQLSVENAKLREKSEKQNRQLSRLDMHNEELKYKLRESCSSPMRDGGSQLRSRNSPHKRYSVADPTAMSQSWHAAEHRSSPRAGNGGGRLLGGAHGSHRSNQSSYSLPRGSTEGFQPRMRRSMSETSPPQDACVRQLFASFTADSGDGCAEDSSAFENAPCSQDDLLRLTWVKEDGDLLQQQDAANQNAPRAGSS
ncbi:uncharacterized protein LOC144128997 isoform X3 [Amblyomma americanum]